MRILDIIYPPRCICCFEVIKNNALTCEECGKDLEKRVNYIDFHAIDFECTSLYRYQGSAKGVISTIKSKKSLTVCKKVGNILADEAERLYAKTPFDLVVYVPMTRVRMIKRGFNQTAVFAKIISKRLNIGFEKEVIKKIRETEPQKSLRAAQRAVNLKDAFKVMKDVDGKSILLVDDVITTGATIKENVKILYKAGARKVTVLTFAKV